MKRPTIRDLSEAAGVSVATVNRVLSGASKVRGPTMERVLDAAKAIGFYGVGALQQRIASATHRHRLGVVSQSPHRSFCALLNSHLQDAAKACTTSQVQLRIEQVDDLSPEQVAARMHELAAECEAIAVVAAEHPIVSDAIDQLAAKGIPVIALISPLAARANVGYVGVDSWKVGRTAAWAFDHLCKTPGKLGVLVGTHRYRCHDLNESGFRSYFREHATPFELLEPASTFESDAIARELTEKLLRTHPDLKGLYVSGGGITGALAAIRESGMAGKLVTVGYDLMDSTKAGLIDGSLTLVIANPFAQLARETIDALIRTLPAGAQAGRQSVTVPFELYTRENL